MLHAAEMLQTDPRVTAAQAGSPAAPIEALADRVQAMHRLCRRLRRRAADRHARIRGHRDGAARCDAAVPVVSRLSAVRAADSPACEGQCLRLPQRLLAA